MRYSGPLLPYIPHIRRVEVLGVCFAGESTKAT